MKSIFLDFTICKESNTRNHDYPLDINPLSPLWEIMMEQDERDNIIRCVKETFRDRPEVLTHFAIKFYSQNTCTLEEAASLIGLPAYRFYTLADRYLYRLADGETASLAALYLNINPWKALLIKGLTYNQKDLLQRVKQQDILCPPDFSYENSIEGDLEVLEKLGYVTVVNHHGLRRYQLVLG